MQVVPQTQVLSSPEAVLRQLHLPAYSLTVLNIAGGAPGATAPAGGGNNNSLKPKVPGSLKLATLAPQRLQDAIHLA